jgi:flavin reductase (DIM6/NTAB) family NADH-FMN oxidoreductase RutF
MKKSLGSKTIIYPTPVFIVGTYDKSGNPNVMAVAWGSICCSKPVCVSIALRKATYTYGNILEQKEFTVNIASQDFVKQVDYFGIASGRNTNKFEDTGFTPVKSDLVNAPYIEEFPLILECKLVHSHELGLHTLFVGEVLDVKVENEFLREDGNPDVKKINPIAYAPGIREYYATGEFLGKAFSIGKEIKKT